jgi:dinuclear metal center YbgI/SA1388 family protein
VWIPRKENCTKFVLSTYPSQDMQTIADLEELMELIAPSRLAEEWDNVGLLVGERSHPLQRLLLCIDLREDVLAEAIGANVDAIVSYHPPIFQPLQKINDSTTQGRILIGALASGIAIHSPHTAADAAADGVNDWLASGLGQGQQHALRSNAIPRIEEEVKIVTFCRSRGRHDRRLRIVFL